jgi:hypothetical protein
MEGQVVKMRTELKEEVQYHLPLNGELIHLNPFIGSKIKLVYLNQINCLSCGKKTKKSFGQGFCYPCFMNAPEASPCILRPELCEAHLGKGRDLEFEEKHHNQPHIVYLALNSAIKIGVTRDTQVPTRWIDQGAASAIALAEVPYRRLAGEIEVFMKEKYTDKTNWQRMLKNEILQGVDLLEEREENAELMDQANLGEYISDSEDIISINYPVLEYPKLVKSLNFDKEPVVEGVLTGIKGQYLMFDAKYVINIRKFSGYHLAFEG